MIKAGHLLGAGALFAVLTVQAAAAPPADHSASYVRVASLFGESDEEKAARLQHEADQDAQIRALNAKLQDLEATLRTLTGQNEELSHRVGDLDAKIERQRKDFEYRLCALAAQQLGAQPGQGDPNAVPCPGSPVAAVAPPAATASAQDAAPSAGMAPPPGVLGTLPASQAAAPPPADDASRAEFAAAMNLLAKASYDEARAAFRAFADAHPASDLAPQAVYWAGDIAYVQKDYDGATRQFAEVIKKYSTSSRAPDSMLKLGQSLLASGDKKGGCTALAALPTKYPKADKAVLAQGADLRKSACRGEA
jgi:tol-pal system protein YbgF